MASLRCLAVGCIALLALAAPLPAQEPPPPSPAEAAPATARVVAVDVVENLPEAPGAIAPNHEVELVVANLEALCPAGRASKPNKPLLVYLDGQPLPGSVPISERPQPDGTTRFRFFLPNGQETQPTWTWVARTTQVLDDPTVTVAVSVGYPDCIVPDQAEAMDATVLVLRTFWRNTWLVLVIGLGALLIWLGRTTNLLRDPTPNRPYSLSKTQAAWWFYLILSGFALILMVTGFPPAFSNDVLILLGLASATGVLGSVIGDQKSPPGATTTTSGGPVQEFLGFWRDLLFDPSVGGISLGRLQFVAWTVVIGVYFAYKALTTLTLPDVGNQLLLLQGISAGTYMATKSGETK